MPRSIIEALAGRRGNKRNRAIRNIRSLPARCPWFVLKAAGSIRSGLRITSRLAATARSITSLTEMQPAQVVEAISKAGCEGAAAPDSRPA